MREIKFRAWDKLEQCFINIKSFGFFEDGEIWYVQATDENENDIDPPYFLDEDRLEIIQFTGIYDKNGKEIYEGNIVKITSPYADDVISKVVWGGTEYPAFDLPKYDGDTMNAFSAIRFNGDDEIEIIGNIYEHPHLLKELG